MSELKRRNHDFGATDDQEQCMTTTWRYAAGIALCNHLVALLFQTAHYTTMGLTTVPPPLSCARVLQSWQRPRTQVSFEVTIIVHIVMENTHLASLSQKFCRTTLNYLMSWSNLVVSLCTQMHHILGKFLKGKCMTCIAALRTNRDQVPWCWECNWCEGL